jgi:hypothetical protein
VPAGNKAEPALAHRDAPASPSLRPHSASPVLPYLLVPNLAAILAVATLFYCLLVFGAGSQLFRDSDAGWHIRNGEWILAHHALPPADPYSFSKAGQQWLAWEWGSDVLLGLAHRADGLRGVTALMALVIAACSWLWCRLNFSAGGNFFLTALLAPLMLTSTSLHWLARPHVFSWLFLLALLLYAEHCAKLETPPRWPELLSVAALTAVWANLHASFFLAPVIALVYALAYVARPLLWPLDSIAEHRKAKWFLYVALASFAGSLLNPYGSQLHAHVLQYLANDDLTSHVAEFQSFNFHDKDATQVVLAMAVAAAGGLLAWGQKKLAHFLLAALFLVGALRSARVIPLVALLLLPLANGAFKTALESAKGLRAPLRRALDATLQESIGLLRIDQKLSGALFIAGAVVLALVALRAPAMSQAIGFPSTRFPVAASAALDRLPAESRVLAPDSYGGYLIYRFNGVRKVYFDGRSDFYGSEFMKQYLVLIQARPGWKELVRSFGFTHALLPGDSALQAALLESGWTTLYRDDVATLLAAPRPAAQKKEHQ